jgi:hypothetical protein
MIENRKGPRICQDGKRALAAIASKSWRGFTFGSQLVFSMTSRLRVLSIDIHLFQLGMEASWRFKVETIDLIVIALVHGVWVKSHTLASYGLQPGNPSPCQMQVWHDLVWLTRQIVCEHECLNHWITVELEKTFEIMESSEIKCVQTGLIMFAGSQMRVLHYHGLYLLTGVGVYGNRDTSISCIEVERNTKV